MTVPRSLIGLGLPLCTVAMGAPARRAALTVEPVGSDSSALHVVAAIVEGPPEALLWDAPYHVADAARLADRIATSGRKLKAIVILHPDHDHFMHAAVIVARFPGTPVYMAPAGLAEYRRTATGAFAGEKTRRPLQIPTAS